MVRCLLLLFGLIVVSCQTEPEPISVPPELQGVWVTTEERYAERAFEITAEDLFFQTGARDYTVHGIRGLRQEEGEGSMTYVFEFRGQSGEREEFRVERRGPTELVFPNQPLVVWRPAAPGDDRPWTLPG